VLISKFVRRKLVTRASSPAIGKDRVVAHVEDGAFEADVILAITGSSLTVTLAPHGTEVREVAVTLRRS
jgi:hypothetical protein